MIKDKSKDDIHPEVEPQTNLVELPEADTAAGDADHSPTDPSPASIQAGSAGFSRARVPKNGQAPIGPSDPDAASPGRQLGSKAGKSAATKTVPNPRRQRRDDSKDRAERDKDLDDIGYTKDEGFGPESYGKISKRQLAAQRKAEKQRQAEHDAFVTELRSQVHLFWPVFTGTLLVGIFLGWYTAVVALAGYVICAVVTIVRAKHQAKQAADV